ncbi:MAG TPA: hypothetical protein PL187_00235 [Caldilinea sp.]|nr:hypothetical protein [Caldilinea sp.]
MQNTNKLAATFKSRKFWASWISVLVSLGVVVWSETQQAEIANSLAVIAGALAPVIVGAIYVMSTAIEDAARARAQTTNKPEANQ